jgi:WD40 repeat protein
VRLALSPDGHVLAGAERGGAVTAWDLPHGSVIAAATASGDVNALSFSPDGAVFAVAGTDRKVRLVDLRQEHATEVLSGHVLQVNQAVLSGDHELVASVSDDKTAILWSASSHHPLATLDGHSDEVQSVALSDDRTLVATGSSMEGDVLVWDTTTGRIVARVLHHTRTVNALAFTKDGTRLISGSSDGSVHVVALRRARVTPAELAGYVRCRVPYRIDRSRLKPVDLESGECSAPVLVP